jgi:hypothetical protein
MLIVYLVIAAAGVTLLLNSFLTFDRLVKAEYAFNRTAWEADGKPNGFFWRGTGTHHIRQQLGENTFVFCLAIHHTAMDEQFN